MDVIYCMKCHNKKRGLSYDSAKSQIAETLGIDLLDIDDGCPSFCGPGAIKHFVEVDGEVVFADDFETLLEELKQF